mmetsp:Transcript_13287/g.30579  ORF Transcript_13287/g.30579 Transcript_13287/m.30579 type:complete len:248 (-) Transcript_13287:102-845(-)
MNFDYGALGWLIMCIYHYAFPIYFAVAWARTEDADRLWKTGPAGDSTPYRLLSGYIIVLWVMNFLNTLFILISVFDERKFQIFRWLSLFLNIFGVGALEVAGIMIIDQVFPYTNCADLGFYHNPLEKSRDACFSLHIIAWMVFIWNVIACAIVVFIVPTHLIIGNDFGYKFYRTVMGSSLARALLPAMFLPAEQPVAGQPTTEQQKLEAGYPMTSNVALEQAVQPSTIAATYPPVSPSNVPVMLGSA